ncbi:MAG: S41 family peptidase [Chloroflexia bacterium]
MKRWTFSTTVLVLCLFLLVFSAGTAFGFVLRGPVALFRAASPSPAPNIAPAQTLVPADLQENFQTFWQVWDLLETYFYDPAKLDPQKMVYGAIRGMVESAGDRYTFFSTPAQTGVERTHLEGEYEGIGAYIDQQDGFPVILGPVHEDTPAARARLRKGDIVIAVDGWETEGVPLEEVIARIKGPAGTQVTLTIARPGEAEPFDVTLTRAHIEVPSVEGKMREGGLAYIKLSVFGGTTARELDAVLKTLLAQNPRGLILDLRGNGGGYLEAAQEVLGRFLRQGIAAYQADREDHRQRVPLIPGEVQAFDLPLVVLVDGGSASASEIVAGALQDYRRATLIGEQTFGKGSIQHVFDLPDGSSVRITVAQWLTPGARRIQDRGLTPEIIVPLTPEDYEAGLDPQLDAAVAYLLGRPLPPVATTPTPTPKP